MRLALRVPAATQIQAVVEQIRKNSGLIDAKAGPTLGLHDLHLDVSLRNVLDAQLFADFAWELQKNGLASRSVTSLFIPIDDGGMGTGNVRTK